MFSDVLDFAIFAYTQWDILGPGPSLHMKSICSHSLEDESIHYFCILCFDCDPSLKVHRGVFNLLHHVRTQEVLYFRAF
jgi:hypothetical protein